MKISKNSILLVGAVTLGALCFVGANHYLRSYLSEAETRLAGAYQTKKVIVAKLDVPAGGVLSEENLAVRSIPERYLASTAMDPGEFDTVSGQRVMVALKPGDPIDRGALERGDHAALSTTVAKGERAITFPVDEISSISGMLVPGDIIDLVYTGQGNTANSYRQVPTSSGDPALPKELMHVRLILQAVPVMATGKTTQKRVVQTEGGGQQEVNVDFNTVTLNVSPGQAEQVLLAQKLGALTAVLRNPDDKTVLARHVLDEATFKQAEPPPRAGVNNYIEMIIGGTGTAGGTRIRSPEGANVLAAAVVKDRPATEALPPSAFDVRSRLGLNPPPAPAPVPFIPPAGKNR